MEDTLQSWQADGHPVEIRYSEAAIESMRQAAMAGLQKVPKRGLEIGGVLLGKVDGNKVQVLQWREVECSHAHGPGFDLSEADEQALNEMLKAAPNDPEMSRFQIVGWFRTRTRGGAYLSEADIDLYNRFFPEQHQIAFVIRPHMYEPAEAGFFFREADGTVHGESSYNEFKLENKRRRLPLDFDPAQNPRKPRTREEGADEAAGASGPEAAPSRIQLGFDPAQLSDARRQGATASTVTRERSWSGAGPSKVTMVPLGPKEAWTRRRVLLTTALVIVALLAVFLGAPALKSVREAEAGLRARDLGGQLLIEWNPNAKVFESATNASLRIVDGAEEREVELSEEELRTGTVSYERKTGDVELHLLAFDGDREVASEITAFVGGSPSPLANAEGGQAPPGFYEEEIKRLSEQIEAERERAEGISRQVESEKSRLGAIR